ncbi:hypothetical protein L9F63_021955 [Diploptera punctata]|uniref:Uncharacterized protein n=1 Tax=Diploptera punctata TaxID=6984 RepID=A0AAD7ZNJ1_DIPPU|nr:hypothetical protein L9F63_021955 [Diploptera punctata]
MNGYNVRISIFERIPTVLFGETSGHYMGIDGFVLNNLIRYMNFTPVINIPEDGMKYGFMYEHNGTFTGSLGDILYDRADISMNSRFIKDYGTSDIEFTTSIMSDNLCVVVPKSKQLPKWLTLFRIFDFKVLCAIVIVYFLYGTLHHFLKLVNSIIANNKGHSTYFVTLLEILPAFLSLSLSQMPSPMSEKVLVVIALIFGMIMASLFQGRLLTVITKADYFADINTLEELSDSGLLIATRSQNLIGTTLETDESDLDDQLKIVYVKAQENMLKYVAKHQDIAALSRMSSAKLNVFSIRNSDGSPLLHIVEECPRLYFLAYIVRKGSPYLPAINKIVLRLIESGFMQQWTESTYYIMTLQYNSNSEQNIPDRAISFQDLQVAFMLLALGNCLVCCVFSQRLHVVKQFPLL